MKKNALKMSLLAAMVVGLASAATACAGGDDDDDDDGGSRPVVAQAGGGTADFTTCSNNTSGGPAINVVVQVGKQSVNPAETPVPTPSVNVVVYDPATGTTSGDAVVTDAQGQAEISVPSNSNVTFKVYRDPDMAVNFVDAYDYSHFTPATSDTTGDPTFGNLRLIPESVRSAIGAILGVDVQNDLPGTMQFAGSVSDCSGAAVTGVTLSINGAEPPRCSGSADLPCVSYSTDTSEDWTDETAQVFVLGLPGTGTTTITAEGVLTEGAAPVTLGTITVRDEADGIALGAIPPQNAQ